MNQQNMNQQNNKSKLISVVLFTCIIIIVLGKTLYWILQYLANKELFRGNSNGKRDKLMKIYKSDYPDENNNINIDSEELDPDSTNGRDPDS